MRLLHGPTMCIATNAFLAAAGRRGVLSRQLSSRQGTFAPKLGTRDGLVSHLDTQTSFQQSWPMKQSVLASAALSQGLSRTATGLDRTLCYIIVLSTPLACWSRMRPCEKPGVFRLHYRASSNARRARGAQSVGLPHRPYCRACVPWSPSPCALLCGGLVMRGQWSLTL